MQSKPKLVGLLKPRVLDIAQVRFAFRASMFLH